MVPHGSGGVVLLEAPDVQQPLDALSLRVQLGPVREDGEEVGKAQGGARLGQHSVVGAAYPLGLGEGDPVPGLPER